MADADQGHTFEISIRSRGSYIVQGDEHHRDEPDFSGEPYVVQIRAWSLKEALEKAVDVPFEVWMISAFGEPPERREGDEP